MLVRSQMNGYVMFSPAWRRLFSQLPGHTRTIPCIRHLSIYFIPASRYGRTRPDPVSFGFITAVIIIINIAGATTVTATASTTSTANLHVMPST